MEERYDTTIAAKPQSSGGDNSKRKLTLCILRSAGITVKAMQTVLVLAVQTVVTIVGARDVISFVMSAIACYNAEGFPVHAPVRITSK